MRTGGALEGSGLKLRTIRTPLPVTGRTCHSPEAETAKRIMIREQMKI
jgi:hypothetical protein